MDILIIGGTKFVGRALVEAALARGHNLTLFHRGQTNSDLFPDVERVFGDRDGELDKLGARQWDVVIDTCGYVPRIVQQSADYLADKVQRYIFISTISVYTESAEIGRDEDAPLIDLDDKTTEEVTGATYGGLKVLCEQAAEAALPNRVLNIRPGLIVGPHDPSNRFTYWVTRGQRGGDILAPGKPDYPVQFIDVRDLAEWTILMAENGATGIYNATSTPHTLGAVFETVKGADDTLVWMDDEFLLEHEVGAWMELPLWVPDEDGQGLMQLSVQRAVDAGLTFRSLADTVQATREWANSLNGELPGQAGLASEREAELLQAWRER